MWVVKANGHQYPTEFEDLAYAQYWVACRPWIHSYIIVLV